MRRLAPALTAAIVVATACSSGGGGRSQPPSTTGDGSTVALVSALRPFDSCSALLKTVKSEALDRVGPYGLAGVGGYGYAADDLTAERATGAAPPTTVSGSATSAPTSAEESDESGQATPEFSGTNVQEQGVDEPDLDKTDGRTLYVVVGDRLRVIDITGAAPSIVGEVALPDGAAHQILLDGSRVLVLSEGAGAYPVEGDVMYAPPGEPDVAPGSPGEPDVSPSSGATGTTGTSLYSPERPPPLDTTVVTTIDVSDPTAPGVTAQATVEGRLLDGRMIDGVARVVTSSTPRAFDFVYPSGSGSQGPAERANRRVIESSGAQDWLPTYTVDVGPGADEGEKPLVDCASVAHTEEFAGFGTLSVSTVDLRGDGTLDPASTTSVQADGENVYASSEHLYVATTSTDGTAIHEFDLTGRDAARYLASGEVRGTLLDQFSMSENDGVLRVATTDTATFVTPDVAAPRSDAPTESPTPPSTATGVPVTQSYVSTLRQDGGELRLVGQVGGLGRGEQIKAVRFIGTTGYVVTFRRTDPLFTIDLSDPAAPTVVGELKIPGYSSYLQPLGDGRLLGIGQDATSQGRVQGLQVALFDVSDPADPQQLQKYTLPGATSDAETEHHALLWWAPEGLAIVPVQDWGDTTYGVGEPFVGAVGLDVGDGGIAERGRIEHRSASGGHSYPDYPYESYGTPILRTLVVGDAVLSISEAGLGTSALGDLTERAWLPFT